MGYKVQRTGYKVTLEDHPGLELVIQPLTVKQVLEFTRLVEQVGDADPEKPDASQVEAFESVLTTFGSLLESWNLEEDDGTQIPATFDGLGTLGLPFAMELIQGAMEAVTQAPRPLPQSSTNGASDADLRALLGSIPMTPIGQ